nr:uncharacterized protein LOC117452246 isoform X2 [Pseudochaenichthys georgianus]
MENPSFLSSSSPVTKNSQDGGPSGRELALASMPSLTSRGNPRTPCNMCTSARHTSFLPSKEPGHPDYIPTKFGTPGKLPTADECQKLRRFWNAMSRHGKKMLGKENGPSTKKCRVASEPPQHQPTPDSPQPSTSSVSPPSVSQQMLFDEISALRAERDAALAERDHARATLNSLRLSSNTVADNNEKCQYYRTNLAHFSIHFSTLASFDDMQRYPIHPLH